MSCHSLMWRGTGLESCVPECVQSLIHHQKTIIARDVYQHYLAKKKKFRTYFMNNGVMDSLTMDIWIF